MLHTTATGSPFNSAGWKTPLFDGVECRLIQAVDRFHDHRLVDIACRVDNGFHGHCAFELPRARASGG